MLQGAASKQKNEAFYYFACMFCKWDSIQLGLNSKLPSGLVQKLTLYKGKYFKSPQ